MSEIGDLIAIMGAIDSAVREDEGDDRRTQVAALVKAYREGNRFGWYDSFVQRDGNQGLPDIETAMRNLRQPTRFAAMLPRRLPAVALAARVFPDRSGPQGEEA